MSTLPLPDPALHDVGLDDGGQRGAKQVRLLEHVGLAPSTDLLEIGCGLGRLAYELAQDVLRASLHELSAPARELLEAGVPSLHWYVMQNARAINKVLAELGV